MSNFAQRRRAAQQSLSTSTKIVLDRINTARIERDEPELRNLSELQRAVAEDEYLRAEVREIADDLEQKLDPSTLQTIAEAQERRTRAMQAAAPVAGALAGYVNGFSQDDNFAIVDEVVSRSIDANEPERVAVRAIKSAIGRRDPNAFFDAARDGALSHDDVEAALQDVQPSAGDESVDPIPQRFEERAAKADRMSVKDLGRLLEEIHAETETDSY